eukprot:scaffold988_cov393-Pavlova_lutheri.AAC.8
MRADPRLTVDLTQRLLPPHATLRRNARCCAQKYGKDPTRTLHEWNIAVANCKDDLNFIAAENPSGLVRPQSKMRSVPILPIGPTLPRESHEGWDDSIQRCHSIGPGECGCRQEDVWVRKCHGKWREQHGEESHRTQESWAFDLGSHGVQFFPGLIQERKVLRDVADDVLRHAHQGADQGSGDGQDSEHAQQPRHDPVSSQVVQRVHAHAHGCQRKEGGVPEQEHGQRNQASSQDGLADLVSVSAEVGTHHRDEIVVHERQEGDWNTSWRLRPIGVGQVGQVSVRFPEAVHPDEQEEGHQGPRECSVDLICGLFRSHEDGTSHDRGERRSSRCRWDVHDVTQQLSSLGEVGHQKGVGQEEVCAAHEGGGGGSERPFCHLCERDDLGLSTIHGLGFPLRTSVRLFAQCDVDFGQQEGFHGQQHPARNQHGRGGSVSRLHDARRQRQDACTDGGSGDECRCANHSSFLRLDAHSSGFSCGAHFSTVPVLPFHAPFGSRRVRHGGPCPTQSHGHVDAMVTCDTFLVEGPPRWLPVGEGRKALDLDRGRDRGVSDRTGDPTWTPGDRRVEAGEVEP